MLAIVFTTTEEASHFVNQYADERIDSLREGRPVKLDNLVLTVTGPGKIKATLNTDRLLREHDVSTILHAGTCVALNEELDVGALLGASYVIEGDRVELNAPTYPRMPLDCPYDTDAEGTMVTQDHMSKEDEDRSYWERIGDARDTTAYAVAYVAGQHGTPCHVVKVLSERPHQETDGSKKNSEHALTAMSRFLSEVAQRTRDEVQ